METSITLFQAYKKQSHRLTRGQLITVGLKAKKLYLQIFGELPPKVESKEPVSINYEGQEARMLTMQVFAYPDDFTTILHNLIEEQAKLSTKKNKKKKNKAKLHPEAV